MDTTVIKIENLRKQYKLGAIGGTTLTAELQSWWAKKRGKENPNIKIGQDGTKIGERFWALDGINLEIKRGEALGIIGGNGAGKSTLLKVLSRVTAPTEGDIWIDGRVSSMLEVGTGFHPELTGRENIYMNGAILGMSRKEVDEKIESIIDFSECRQFIDTPVKRYSSGMYVKLAFAVASHLDSDIMIMDEVLAVGDMKFQKKCLNKMGDEAREGKTVLYVSHNMSTIRNLCSRCVVLKNGKIAFDGDVESAIGVYMDIGNHDKPTIIDNRDKVREDAENRLGRRAKIVKVEILDKESAVFRTDETVVMRVELEKYEHLSDAYMGMELYSADMMCMAFGTIRIDDIMETNVVDFEFKCDFLVEGEYSFKFNLHFQDDINNFAGSIDQTDNIFFEVINTKNKIIWHPEWWGRYRLSQFTRRKK